MGAGLCGLQANVGRTLEPIPVALLSQSGVLVPAHVLPALLEPRPALQLPDVDQQAWPGAA